MNRYDQEWESSFCNFFHHLKRLLRVGCALALESEGEAEDEICVYW